MKTKSLLLVLLKVILLSCTVEPLEERVEQASEASVHTPAQSSVLYLNKVGYFPETGEFYVSLHSIKPLTEEDYNFLSKKADSVVFDDNEKGRFRLPKATAREYFNFSSLDTIKVYDSEHNFITKATLARAEHFLHINGYFIAVFKPADVVPDRQADFYCLGTASVELEDLTMQSVASEELTERIIKELDLKPEYVWHSEHVLVEPYNATYSVYAFSEGSGKTISYITELKDNELRVLYKLQEEYTLNSIQPVPVERNGKPVLLLHLTLPESDAVDDYVVGVYDGKEYQLLPDNRIKLK
ncbi:hypothetical protein [Pontibacter kalidii]|uniref:hypothetical protein n=1 Tax=Pontibacter kalidii TaxID=2592049 RepID=UPI00224DA9B7|nr:hypothetical protein [Pontibacter kalidii]